MVRRSNGIPVEMKRGTALFMHRLTLHSSLRNLSNAVRWSFDLRYQPVGQATGRDWLPAFVARSRADRRQEIRDWRRWADLWWQARDYVAADADEISAYARGPDQPLGLRGICQPHSEMTST